MNDIFGYSPAATRLAGVRVCLNGEFTIDAKEMTKCLKILGVSTIDRVSNTRVYKEGDAIPPTKEGTNLYVIGKNPNQESIKRYELNAHDGYKAIMITEEQLMQIIHGELDIEIPNTTEKHLDLTMDYYNWTAPVINDKVFTSRVSSPLVYLEDKNPITLKEIYVPDYDNIDTSALRQLIGNLGGYANREYFDDTNIVMLSDETLNKLKLGEKDAVILQIEEKYNNSDSKSFNVQFTSESQFLDWAESRAKRFDDSGALALLNRLGR